MTTICNRCGKELSNDWTDGWPNSLSLRAGHAAQIGCALNGDYDGTTQFSAWNKHPALTMKSAQDIEVKWPQPGMDLCHKCQRDFLTHLGSFLKTIKRKTTLELIEETP